MKRAALLLGMVVVLAAAGPRAAALETDQYYAWGRPLADSTDAINAKFNLELERAIESFDSPPDDCMDVVVRFRKRMRFVLFHNLQLWVMNSPLVARIPVDADDDAVFRTTNMYRDHGLLDVGMWMTFTPTIAANDVRFGADKLSHFISSGWTYFTTYRRALRRGRSPDEAEHASVRRGILEERLILGKATTGVLSLADLEANYQGMRFYIDTCSGPAPILERGAGGWRVARPFELRDYVNPGWDESYRVSVFTKGRWRKVRNGLEQYCDRRTDPQVQEMMRRYERDEQQTAAGRVIDELVAAGHLPDPSLFSLDAVCPPIDDAEPAFAADEEAAAVASAGAPAAAADAEQLTRLIIEQEATEPRTVHIAAFRLTDPQVVSASYGWLFTRQPPSYECRTVCDHWGTFAQVEPGLGGGKLSVGWGRVIGEQMKGDFALSSVLLAMGIKGTVLRTWGDRSRLPDDQTYAGAEFEFSVARVNMGVGVLNRLSGEEGAEWVITSFLGWGF